MTTRIIPKHGGYKKLLSYQKTVVIYDITHIFTSRFMSRGDRTIDQMVQAARSGKQNIIEGSQASATSRKMELKLTNVARASLEELLEDYRDYLRSRNAILWHMDSPEATYIRRLGRDQGRLAPAAIELARTRKSTVVANIAICFIHQANFLLNQQIRRLEQDFLSDGGLTERMYKARSRVRRD